MWSKRRIYCQGTGIGGASLRRTGGLSGYVGSRRCAL